MQQNRKMRLIFFGSGQFAVQSLSRLVDEGYDIGLVCTQEPKQAGRGRTVQPTPVEKFARMHALPVRSPRDPGDFRLLREIQNLAPQIGVLVDYARLLPEELLSIPEHGILNVHPSLLPRWRGAAPIHRAILAGDDQTGVCIMRMNAELDRGPVLLRTTVPIHQTDTTGSLSMQLAQEGSSLLVDALDSIADLSPLALDTQSACYAYKIDKGETRIDWTRDAESVDRQIRGLSPSPGAWGELQNNRFKFLDSRSEAVDGVPGQVLDDQFLVACGTGAVRILRLQRAGKSAMDAADFLRGFTIGVDAQFVV